VRDEVEEIHEEEEWDAGEIGELEVAAVETVPGREEQRLGVTYGDPEWFHPRRRSLSVGSSILSHTSVNSNATGLGGEKPVDQIPKIAARKKF
jgi:hypothetical protein